MLSFNPTVARSLLLPLRQMNRSASQFSTLGYLINKWLGKEIPRGPVKITYMPKDKLQQLCDRNFERKLKELAEKSKETVTKSSPLKKEQLD